MGEHTSSRPKDLMRGRAKVPRAAYKGDSFGGMSTALNKWLLADAPKARDCEEFTVEELQNVQLQLYVLRDTQLDAVYHNTSDKRRIQKDIRRMSKEWEELNSLAVKDP